MIMMIMMTMFVVVFVWFA